jgi:hypothetical protein
MGHMAAWESGGGWSRTGSAVVIAGSEGQPLKPIFVRNSGPLACEKHALLPVKHGDWAVRCDRYGDDYRITIARLVGNLFYSHIDIPRPLMDGIPDEFNFLTDAINAVVEKSKIYHCRGPVYIKV